MRIEIPTGGKPVKDRDIRAIYVLDKGLQMCTDRMLKANIDFALSKYLSDKKKKQKP